MTDNTERESFEKAFLIPDCVNWCANSGRYTHQYAGGEEALNDCIHYNALWQGFQLGRAQVEAVRDKAIVECLEAVKNEKLTDGLDNDADRAYNSAIKHCSITIESLRASK